jgi:alanine dehydrogenase
MQRPPSATGRGLPYGKDVVLLSRTHVEELLSIDEAIEAVEYCFKLEAEGSAIMPPKLYLHLTEYGGDFRAMPAYIDGYAGIKWVSVYPNNPRHNLASVMATILLSDPNNGYPLIIMDGSYITEIRTGAAGGVAAKYLARKDSSIVGIIGAGVQARTQLLAIHKVFPRIERVKIFDKYWDASVRYTDEMSAKLHIDIYPVKAIEEAAEADIVITTTPSRKPIVKKHYIRPGTHINAIGADARGKQELESDLTRSAKIVVDNIEQATHSGEINVPLSKGILNHEDIYGTIGEVAAGLKPGRESDEISIFDSTGLAVQDIICAKLVYEKVKGRDMVNVFSFM